MLTHTANNVQYTGERSPHSGQLTPPPPLCYCSTGVTESETRSAVTNPLMTLQMVKVGYLS
jgi:hypothetical protein